MNLKQLYYFKTLARICHYSKAADELLIAQSTLSYAIDQLEKELGTYLFSKQNKVPSLTKSGKIFLEYVDTALDTLERGEKKIREYESPSHGTVDIGLVGSIGARYIPDILNRFSSIEKNKHISFCFSQANTKEIISLLKDGSIDLAICSFADDEKDVYFIPIILERLVVVVSKDHELAKYDEIDLVDTLKYPYLYFSKRSGLRPLIDKLFKNLVQKPNVLFEVEDAATMASLVSSNLGITVMPDIYIIKSFDLKSVKIKNNNLSRIIYLAYLKNAYLSPAASNFKNFIIDHYN